MLKPSGRGFTLIELIVTLTVAALLVTLAAPSMGTWVNNTRVRSAAESLQNGLRRAQGEAVARGTQVIFVLSTDAPSWNTKPVADGGNWAVRAHPPANSADASGAATADTFPLLEASSYASANAISVKGPALLCFNSMGRMITSTAVPVTNVGAASCALPAAATYVVKRAVSPDSEYRVTVSVGGRIRMCNAKKVLSSDNPDGC